MGAEGTVTEAKAMILLMVMEGGGLIINQASLLIIFMTLIMLQSLK